MVADREESEGPSKIVSLATELSANVLGAAMALQGSPVAAILGAASVPVVQRVAGRVMDRRSRRLGERLKARGIDAETVIRMITTDPSVFDLFGDALRAAATSDHDAKCAFLGDILAEGLLSAEESQIAYARRVVQSLQRIDALEILVLDFVERKTAEPLVIGGNSGEVSVDSIVGDFPWARREMMDAGLAILDSEGLIRVGSAVGSISVSDYGRRILREMRARGLNDEGPAESE